MKKMIVAALAAMVMITGLSANMEECRQASKQCEINLTEAATYLQQSDYTRVRILASTFETTLYPNFTRECNGILSDQTYADLKAKSELWISLMKQFKLLK